MKPVGPGASVLSRSDSPRSEIGLTAPLTGSQSAIVLCNATGTIEWASDALRVVAGSAPEDVIGRSASDIAGKAGIDAATVASVFARAQAYEPFQIEISLETGARGSRHLEICVQPVPSRNGGASDFVVVIADATERRRAERALAESEDRHRRLVESCPDPIVVHSQGRLRFVNAAGVSLLGASGAGELVGRPILDFVHPDFHGIVAERVRKMQETGESVYLLEEKLLRVDGRAIDVEVAGGHVVYQGEPAIQLVGRDITERKRADEERERMHDHLREARRRESLVAIAEGVSQQLAGLSATIVDTADEALSQTSPAASMSAFVAIRRAGLRMARLTEKLRAFAGKPKVVRRRIDLSQLIIDISELLEVEVGNRASLSYELPGDLPRVTADATLLRRVVLSLVRNAADALGGAPGAIRVRTHVVEADASTLAGCQPPGALTPGRYVALEVRDTGCGMSDETRSRILDPFFSTKSPERGLGLCEVLGLVQAQNGGIQVESAPGRGTRVTVYFPLRSTLWSVDPRQRASTRNLG